MNSQVGAFLVAIGSTVQAIRWLIRRGVDLKRQRTERKLSRVDRLNIRRETKVAEWDWITWVLISAGAWIVFAAGF